MNLKPEKNARSSDSVNRGRLIEALTLDLFLYCVTGGFHCSPYFSRMGKVTANAPSRQRVVCGHRGCSHEAELRNMKKHNERKHGGVMRIKNSSFGVGGKWARWNALSGVREESTEDNQAGMFV